MTPDRRNFLSRRDFLKLGGAALSAIFLAGCTKDKTNTPVPPTETVPPNNFPIATATTEVDSYGQYEFIEQSEIEANLKEPYEHFKNNPEVKALFSDSSTIEYSAMGIKVYLQDGGHTNYIFFEASSETEEKGYIAMVLAGEQPGEISYTILNRIVDSNGMVGLGLTNDIGGNQLENPIMIFSTGLTEKEISQLTVDDLLKRDMMFIPGGIKVPSERINGAKILFSLAPMPETPTPEPTADKVRETMSHVDKIIDPLRLKGQEFQWAQAASGPWVLQQKIKPPEDSPAPEQEKEWADVLNITGDGDITVLSADYNGNLTETAVPEDRLGVETSYDILMVADPDGHNWPMYRFKEGKWEQVLYPLDPDRPHWVNNNSVVHPPVFLFVNPKGIEVNKKYNVYLIQGTVSGPVALEFYKILVPFGGIESNWGTPLTINNREQFDITYLQTYQVDTVNNKYANPSWANGWIAELPQYISEGDNIIVMVYEIKDTTAYLKDKENTGYVTEILNRAKAHGKTCQDAVDCEPWTSDVLDYYFTQSTVLAALLDLENGTAPDPAITMRTANFGIGMTK